MRYRNQYGFKLQDGTTGGRLPAVHLATGLAVEGLAENETLSES